MANKNLYEILGLEKDADDKAIKKAYRKMSLKWHPDKHTNDSEEDKKFAEEKFKDISEAYNVLSDPDKRKKYDLFGTIDGSDGGVDMGFDDIMSHFMRGHTGFGFGNGGGNSYHRGSDKKIRINVSIEDVFFNRLKNVSYDIEVMCDECNGRGSNDGVDARCPYCGGSGVITETKQWGNTMMQSSHPCPHCQGTGFYTKDPCKKCGGTGTVVKRVTKEFKIPSIDKLGYTYKMDYEGNACHNNRGPKGDLYFTYAIKDDENSLFHVDPSNYINIYTTLDLSVFECLIGCEKEISTVDGKKLKLTIPKCTKDGHIFKINGYGFRCDNGNVGSLLIKVNMTMPNLTDEKIEKIKEIMTDD